MEHPQQPEQSASPLDLESMERREALRRLGRYASYIPPTVLTLLVSRKASAASIGDEDPPDGGGGPP